MEGFGEAPRLHRRSPSEALPSLLSWEQLADIIAERPGLGIHRDVVRSRHSGGLGPGSNLLEIGRGGRPLSRSEWAAYVDGPIDAAALTACLRGGASLFLRRIEEFVPEVASYVESIEQQLDAPANAVAVASMRTTPGAALHLDAEDGLIVQCEGRKRWLIHRPTRIDAFPTALDVMAVSPEGDPELDLVLEAGDVLHVPRGWWHQVLPLDEPSLHITFNVFRRTGVDLFDWMAVDSLPPELLDAPVDEPTALSELVAHLSEIRKPETVARFRSQVCDEARLIRPQISLLRRAR